MIPKGTPRTHLTDDERFKLVENMRKYGGGFVVSLSDCFMRADQENTRRLCLVFPEYVETYLEKSPPTMTHKQEGHSDDGL